MKGLPENLPELEDTCPIFLLKKATKITIVPANDVSKSPLGSCLKNILRFSMLEASADLTQRFWLYAMLLHTPLHSHPEASFHLLTS